MPMRIISQGRHAYVLAGYLMKRGKWSWQWSERYFVLTATALHYFKRDRRELYGKERGQFLVADMTMELQPDKLIIEIKSRSTGQTRMLKAPTEREYLTWCHAFQDVLARPHGSGANAAGAAPSAGSSRMGAGAGQALDALHAREANRLAMRHGSGSKENSHSQSGSFTIPRGGNPLHSGLGGTPAKPMHSANPLLPRAATTPVVHDERRHSLTRHTSSPLTSTAVMEAQQPQHGRSATAGPPSIAVNAAQSGMLQSQQQHPASARHSTQHLTVPSLPPSSSALPSPGTMLSRSAAAATPGGSTVPSASPVVLPSLDPTQPSPETLQSGYSAQPSASPLHHPHGSFEHKHAPPPLAGLKPRSSSNAASSSLPPHHHEHDVLRKYSHQAGPGGDDSDGGDATDVLSSVVASGAHDALLMVTLEGGPALDPKSSLAPRSGAFAAPASAQSSACSTSQLIVGKNIPWNTPLSLPVFFTPASSLRVTLGDGSQLLVPQSLMAEELARGMRSGSKVVSLAAGSDSALAEQYRNNQVLFNWRVSDAPQSAEEKKAQQVELALPGAFVLLLALCILFSPRPGHWMHALFALVGAGMAAHSMYRQGERQRAERVARQRWEITFVSLIEQPLAPGAAAAAASALSTPPKLGRGGASVDSSASGGGATSSASRKKKGILRRRANDLPGEQAGLLQQHQPLMAHSAEGALRDFEMSEYSDSGATSHENSQVGHSSASALRHRHRRPAPVDSGKAGGGRIMASSSGDDLESAGGELSATASAPPPRMSSAAAAHLAAAVTSSSGGIVAHASPPPNVGVGVPVKGQLLSTEKAHARALSGEAEYLALSAGGSSEKASPNPDPHSPAPSTAPPSSASAAATSSGASSHSNSRLGGGLGGGGRSDADSEGGELGHTDAESRDLSDEEDEDDEEDEAARAKARLDEAALLDLLNAYEDTPKLVTPAHMPAPTPAPWGLWSEDDTSALNVRGPTFSQDKIKVPVGVPIFKLQHVDMFYTAQSKPNLTHVCSRPGNWGWKYMDRRAARWREMHGGSSPPPVDNASPLFVLNFLFPGPAAKNMNLVLYFVRRIRPGEELKRRRREGATGNNLTTAASSRRPSQGGLLSPTSAEVGSGSMSGASSSLGNTVVDIDRVCSFDGLLREFLDGPDEYRDCRLKIIPRIAAGPWLVRKGVGCVPAILGKKVSQLYFRSRAPARNYIEVVADVSSSVVAGRILALVKGAATALTIDLAFTLQGETPDELPESLLGGVRIMQCNLDALMEVDDHEKWLEDTWLKQEKEAGRW